MTRKVVFVRWSDAHHASGWTRDTPDNKPTPCVTVGIILAEDEEAVTVCCSISEEDDPQHCGQMTIPKVCIVSMIEIDGARLY